MTTYDDKEDVAPFSPRATALTLTVEVSKYNLCPICILHAYGNRNAVQFKIEHKEAHTCAFE